MRRIFEGMRGYVLTALVLMGGSAAACGLDALGGREEQVGGADGGAGDAPRPNLPDATADADAGPVTTFEAGPGDTFDLDGGEIVDAAVTIANPATCGEAAGNGMMTDGEVMLFVQRDRAKGYKAYCAGMPTAPRTYLTLKAGANNTSGYKADGIFNSTDVTTTWVRVRFDPVALAIFGSDYTFSSSVGLVNHLDSEDGGVIRRVPYGVARDCWDWGSSRGRANIELTDLPFTIDVNRSNWLRAGYRSGGFVNAQAGGRLLTVGGGGYCGWAAPSGDRFGNKPIYLVYSP